MKLKNVMIVVQDIERSKAFYKELFGLDVIFQDDGNVILTEGLVLQAASVWEQSIQKAVLSYHHAAELYFEEEDMDGFLEKLHSYREPVSFLTPLTEDSQGRAVVRLYDPDGNVIEVVRKGYL